MSPKRVETQLKRNLDSEIVLVVQLSAMSGGRPQMLMCAQLSRSYALCVWLYRSDLQSQFCSSPSEIVRQQRLTSVNQLHLQLHHVPCGNGGLVVMIRCD